MIYQPANTAIENGAYTPSEASVRLSGGGERGVA